MDNVDTVTVESFIPATRISQPQQCALIVDSVYSNGGYPGWGEMSLCAPPAPQQPGRATTGDCAGTVAIATQLGGRRPEMQTWA